MKNKVHLVVDYILMITGRTSFEINAQRQIMKKCVKTNSRQMTEERVVGMQINPQPSDNFRHLISANSLHV
jgi:hypothetical protein